MSFNLDAKGLQAGIGAYLTKMEKSSLAFGEVAGKRLEADAKQNAPWTDRSAVSRQTIQGGAERVGTKIQVYVAGNTEYFPYLELCHEKKFAILWPTIEKNSHEIISGWANFLNK